MDIATLINNLKYIMLVVNFLAFLAAGICYMTGIIKISIPSSSRKLKASGHEDIETSGLAVFLILFFTTLVNIACWILGATIPKPP